MGIMLGVSFVTVKILLLRNVKTKQNSIHGEVGFKIGLHNK